MSIAETGRRPARRNCALREYSDYGVEVETVGTRCKVMSAAIWLLNRNLKEASNVTTEYLLTVNTALLILMFSHIRQQLSTSHGYL
jgi:Na+-translocating ferredoxin:NAD+ oxidoreductase RnfA subunit